jgi:AraC-like DNA-binding protein
MFYWYIRSILSDNSGLKKWDFLHLLPSAIFLLTSIPYMLAPWSHKIGNAYRLVQDIGYLREMKVSLLYEIIPTSVIFFSRPVLILIYAIWSTVLFIRWILQNRGLQVIYRQRYVTIWLSVLLGFLFIMTISHLIILIDTFTNERVTLFYTLNLLMVLTAVGFAGLLISPFFFPGILYGLPRLPESVLTAKNKVRELHRLNGLDKKTRHGLESDYIRSIGQKTDSCMQELQPYLQKDFNLAQLSSLIHIPGHHLAYYFREDKKQSFNDYRNTWRVNHAKKLIREGQTDRMTLEAIGLLSGFSSRNTFFIAFKRAEGISPSLY